MQLTKHTDLSLRVLMYLALNPKQGGTIADVAQRYGVSRNHLVKVVHRLATLGYLKSVQGRGGGIYLARPAAEINVGQVVRSTENTLEMVDCTRCPLLPGCQLKGALAQATRKFLETLDDYTIADLTQDKTQMLRLIS